MSLGPGAGGSSQEEELQIKPRLRHSLNHAGAGNLGSWSWRAGGCEGRGMGLSWGTTARQQERLTERPPTHAGGAGPKKQAPAEDGHGQFYTAAKACLADPVLTAVGGYKFLTESGVQRLSLTLEMA